MLWSRAIDEAVDSVTGGPQIALLPDGRRLHMQHGPIDLIIEAFGPADERRAAYGQAAACFDGLLATLVDELDLLRRPIAEITTEPAGPVARRMAAACRPHAGVFVTPMAAVAGAVADEVLAAMIAGRALARAYVNDGGDIALHLAPGERFDAGLVGDLAQPAIDGIATIDAALPVRGIATSGRGGRSLSLGIAEAVTVLACNAAAADVAATLIANAVDVDDRAIERRPATDLDADSDLGARLVTVAVGPLAAGAVDRALDAGAAYGKRLLRAGLIHGAVLVSAGRHRIVGDVARRIAAPNEDRSRGLTCR
jgi:ApbE superfamily uncharacterized protein (UPF0280 family)